MNDAQPSDEATRTSDPGPNSEQAKYWSEEAGPKWVELQDQLDAMVGPLGEQVMDRARIVADQNVIDVGCGCGQTSLELGRRVGAGGRVLALDVSTSMLGRARERAADAGLQNAEFRLADAQTADLSGQAADRVFSRFGVMFFVDPTAAFANLRGGLAPDGQLHFVCWNDIRNNPWMLEPSLAVAKHVELPARGDPHAPGPFAFADAERVRGILSDAGFADIRIEPVQSQLLLGGHGGMEAAIDFLLQMGPAGAALRQAGVSDLEPVRASLREVASRYETDSGVSMPCAVWMVSAKR